LRRGRAIAHAHTSQNLALAELAAVAKTPSTLKARALRNAAKNDKKKAREAESSDKVGVHTWHSHFEHLDS
jgi:hypothetical protein